LFMAWTRLINIRAREVMDETLKGSVWGGVLCKSNYFIVQRNVRLRLYNLLYGVIQIALDKLAARSYIVYVSFVGL